MRREGTGAHFGHGRECLWRLHTAALGVEQGCECGCLLETRRQPEEFSFHAEKFTQSPGEEICIEAQEAVRNLLSAMQRS
jgi:hypothetical protein